jgi:hypothetical protein
MLQAFEALLQVTDKVFADHLLQTLLLGVIDASSSSRWS